ncbi:MAG: AbiH family protein [Eubacteriales bacterium]|nr:AbiH family protein [Eubacteriales bacterium]
MNITFMIGNGFDLGCGLKTRYTDVYSEYIKTPSFTDLIADFKETIAGDISTWADFEMAMAGYASKFNSEDDFVTCLRNFRKYTKKHVIKEQQMFWKRISNIESLKIELRLKMILFSALNNFYKLSTNNQNMLIESILPMYEDFYYYCINFNYTNIFEQLFLKYDNCAMETVHVHGDVENDIVLGIDNENQLSNISYEITGKMRTAFIKPEYNTVVDRQRIEKATKTIAHSNVIVVFGLKLGESDQTWREAVLNWLISDEKHHLFFYSHKAMSETDVDPDEGLELERDYRKMVLSSWQLNDDAINGISNQVHLPIGKNIFEISKVLDELEATENDRLEKIHQLNSINQSRAVGSLK